MNITDLGFKFEINTDFDGDFDGGRYYLTLKQEISSHGLYASTNETYTLDQLDIEAIYEGAMKLAKALKHHVRQGY